MWRDEAQRRVHQSTMETGNVSRVQRMHSAEARSRHALSMHTVRPVARRSTLSVKASQPAVEHVSRLPFMRHQKKNVLFATRTKQRNFSAPPHGTRENLNEDCAYVAKLKLAARGSARPVANESRTNNFPALSPDGHQERMARKHAIHAVLPWCRIQSASVLPRPPLRD